MIKIQGYRKRWLFLLAPIVGIVIAGIYLISCDDPDFSKPIYSILHSIVITSGLWAGCTIIVGYLWVKYPWEKTPVKHLIFEIILILVYTNIFSYGLYKLELYYGLIEPADDLANAILITNLITFLITGIHEAAEFYNQWKYNFSKSVRLEKDNIEAKYEMLKSQVNPHFLFNSLNSLVTIVEDNERAVNYISNLSDFLRYMLKSRDRQVILIREELKVLNQYIQLQQSRFGSNLQVNIDIDEKYFHYCTPPLVAQMLVENCIKHNVISKSKPLQIRVWAEKNRLMVENNLQLKTDQESTGQGLRNISERYQFFTCEQVQIKHTDTTFTVSVPLLLVDL